MELSLASRPQSQSTQALTPGQAGRVEPAPCPAVFHVPVPADLRQFGDKVRASALGDPGNLPVVVFGGISANCFPALQPDGTPGWWAGLAGEGQAIDPRFHYVIGLDFAADDAGIAAPSTLDQARILTAALDTIGVYRPVTIVGASYGAMVGLALAAADPARVARLVVVSAGAEPHPASTAARELQRRVVSLGLLAGRGDEALAIARGMAMLTYRTPQEFQVRFDGGIAEDAPLSCSAPGAYLQARGHAFRSVMSPGRFLSLSASIDRHRVRPQDVSAPCLLIGAKSDQLVFPEQLERLSEQLAGPAELHLLESLFGHDMFLKEAERIGKIVAPFLAKRG
jgi:homoserine O-acetyltransferase/O-succinyltransferase